MRVVLIFVAVVAAVLGLSHLVWMAADLGSPSPLTVMIPASADVAINWLKNDGLELLLVLLAMVVFIGWVRTFAWGVIRLFYGISFRKANQMYAIDITGASTGYVIIGLMLIVILVCNVVPSGHGMLGIALALIMAAATALAGLVRIILMPHEVYAESAE